MKTSAVVIAVVAFLVLAGPLQALTTTGWTEYASNPVLDPAERAYYPWLLKESGTCTMWYDDGSNQRLATSANGVDWSAGTSCTGLTNARHATVTKVGDDYRMWYWDSSQIYSIAAIRTATSADGVNWSNDQALTQVLDGSGVGTVVKGAGYHPQWNYGTYGPSQAFYNPGGSETLG